jgi:hypothetical protein
MEAVELTLAISQTFMEYKEAEEAYKEPLDELKLKGPKKITDFIDDWPKHIAIYNRQNGCPLLYVLREIADVPDKATDPTFGEFATVYGS